jgi:hypothetical protein
MARRSILVLVVSALSFVGVGVWAQSRRDPTVPTTVPEILAGENVGVRVTGSPDRNGKLPGRLVVKIDGKWVEVISSLGIVEVAK